MKLVTFLIVNGVLKPSSLFNAIEIFEKANEFFTEQGLPPCYEIQLAGANLDQNLQNASFSLGAVMEVENILKTDCIVIPGFDSKYDFAIRNNTAAIDWITTQYAQGAEVLSLCTGAFLLAATGLLDGKPCSTHWRAESLFKKLFPKLLLHTSKIMTDHQGIYTAGGAISSLNLILYLIEKYNGREAALYCAKVLQIDMERHSQSPFIIFKGLKEHHDQVIRTAQDYIENNVSKKVTVDGLAERFAMDRINFSRRFKKATRLSPIDYIQRVKMEAAKRTFESTDKNVNEVMYAVGYNDGKAFRTIFKKIAGLTPLEYKVKFAQLQN